MISDDVLTKFPAESLAAVSARLRNGDILLCAAHDPFSRLIGWSTRSPWTHVALAWRFPAIGRIVAFECVQKLGVRATSLERFISQTSSGVKPYPGKIILARHAEVRAKQSGESCDRIRDLADFAVDRLGDRFSGFEVLKIGLRIAAGRLHRRMPRFLGPDNEFICSEFVAKCFDRMGCEIAWDRLGFIAPADFARDPNVRAVARFRTR